MAQNREKQISEEAQAFFDSPAEKKRAFSSLLMKGVALVFLLASIAYIIFSVFPDQSTRLRYTTCDGFFRNAPTLNHENDNNIHEEKTNISHILFGIGGSAKTWKNRKHYSELWWKPNVTRGFVWLDEKPADSWPETSPPFIISEDASKFKKSAVRIARIVLESYRLGLGNVRWFVMGDDDTVFFTDNLVSVLSRYDHNQMYYVGGNSESVEQDEIHSYGLAYGGGGFAVSYSLAAELEQVLDGCMDRYQNLYGSDERIMACLSEIGIPLTKELGFHQVDIREDTYGLLAAHPVAPLVSLHHLDAVKPLFPTGTQLESLVKLMNAYDADPGRTLQQSFCHDHQRNWSVSVSWGYTVQIYPYLMKARDLGIPLRTFKTWRSWRDGPFTFNTRAISADPCKRPLIYFLDRVNSVSETETVSSYTRHVTESNRQCDRADFLPALAVHLVNVTAPKMASDEWKKAPRRQCCEIKKETDGIVSVIKIRIRRCERVQSLEKR